MIKIGGLTLSSAKEIMDSWLMHRNVLEEMLKQFDDKHMDYKPWDGAMTVAELALHIASASEMFVSMVRTEKFVVPEIPECKTIDDVRTAVQQFSEKTKAIFETLTDEELASENSAPHPKLKGPKKNYLTAMLEHEIHHKGQLFVYARMVGIKELPFFR